MARPAPEKSEIVPLTMCSSRRSAGVFLGLRHHGEEVVFEVCFRISLFILSSALVTSAETFSILRLLTNSFILGSGPRSLRAIASLSVSALPMTLRLAPQARQYCWPELDSVPHCGQYIR